MLTNSPFGMCVVGCFADYCVQAEQEERRRLESEVRKFRQNGGPLDKRSGSVVSMSASGSATPV